MLKVTSPCDGEKCHMFFLQVPIDLNLAQNAVVLCTWLIKLVSLGVVCVQGFAGRNWSQ
jgi:hypothetical protein